MSLIFIPLPAWAGRSGGSRPGRPKATALSALVREAQRNNPRIIAALRKWQGVEQTPSIARTLPDPEFEIQQFSVGSPRPFAGYSNSNFAYIGFGISQAIPYPGKLRLKGEIARTRAAAAGDDYESVKRSVIQRVRIAYFQLAASVETMRVLRTDQQLLSTVVKAAEAGYSSGQGSEADVLKAQLQRTRMFQTISLEKERSGTIEAKLKQLLNRAADSPDIVPDQLKQTALSATVDELMARVRTSNPGADANQKRVEGRGLGVELAHKNFYPDFRVQYMWQHTAAPFRDYYMLSFGVSLPIHRRARLEPELIESAAELNTARRRYESSVQQAYFQVREQYLAAKTDEHILTLYRQGLLPLAEAGFQASMASYTSHREDFQSLMSTFLQVTNLNEEYWQTLANYEIAIARLEAITGDPLLERAATGTSSAANSNSLQQTEQGRSTPEPGERSRLEMLDTAPVGGFPD